MTGGPDVTVRFGDDALVALVVDAARAVPGVVRLHRRPATVLRQLGRGSAAVPRSDASAVSLSTGPGDVLEVSVRVVSTLQPTPREVIDAVAVAVRERLAVAGRRDVRVEVTVTDVRR